MLPVLQVIWPGLFERYNGRLQYEFDISTLAHISESFSSGALDTVVRSMLTKSRLERLKQHPVNLPEILQWLCKVCVRGNKRGGVLTSLYS